MEPQERIHLLARVARSPGIDGAKRGDTHLHGTVKALLRSTVAECF